MNDFAHNADERANAQNVHERANARVALACLDLTSLNDNDDVAAIDALCHRAVTPYGYAAAVCVWPRFVAQARTALPREVAVAAVANFPVGAFDIEGALADAHAIVDAGGDEVDLVLPWRAMQEGGHVDAARLVAKVRQACIGKRLKLIIESGELPSTQAIQQACSIGLDNGVDFLKTSTGKTAHGASLAAAREMMGAIASHRRGAAVGFKAAGGIRTVADAAGYIMLARQVLGPGAAKPMRLRFGASGLLGDIERVLSGGSSGDTVPGSAY
jgi:deoxyribose-phosphate aldolase